MAFDFTLPGFESINLKQNGHRIDVTIKNLNEYLELLTECYFDKTVKH